MEANELHAELLSKGHSQKAKCLTRLDIEDRSVFICRESEWLCLLDAD